MKWHWRTPVFGQEGDIWEMYFYGLALGLVFLGVMVQRRKKL